jgi:hypothetical protein
MHSSSVPPPIGSVRQNRLPGPAFRVVSAVLSGLAVSAAALPPPEFNEVAPGLAYAHVAETNQPWSVHIARLELGRPEYRFDAALAQGTVAGLASVPQQVRATGTNPPAPILAVNGDFFEIRPGPYQGDPRGLHIRRGELLSVSAGPAFWLDRAGRPRIGEVTPRARVTWPDGASSAFDLNGPVTTNRAALFTPTFGPSTRATNALEFVLEPTDPERWLPLRANQTFTARVAAVQGEGNTPLKAGRMVLAVDATACPPARGVRIGDRLRLETTLGPDFSAVPTAIGGWPILVSPDRAREWTLRPGRANPRHPRTAIGYNERYLFLLVVDGRQPRLSVGMTFTELADAMRELGCVEALNLDGGGSSTFWLEGRVRNSPSDLLPRPVANALLLLRDANGPAVQR